LLLAATALVAAVIAAWGMMCALVTPLGCSGGATEEPTLVAKVALVGGAMAFVALLVLATTMLRRAFR
jgi:hypothetical protein